MVDSIKSFYHYLYGRKFLVCTDHASLRCLMSFRDLEGQLARWAKKLQQYDFEISHRSGQSHRNADGLSRRPYAGFNCKYCLRIEKRNAVKQERQVARIVLCDNVWGVT